jgi:hypothetical protein
LAEGMTNWTPYGGSSLLVKRPVPRGGRQVVSISGAVLKVM